MSYAQARSISLVRSARRVSRVSLRLTLSIYCDWTEHMEVDDNTPETLPPWVQLEYSHILERTHHTLSSTPSQVFFTNLSPRAATSLSHQLAGSASSSSSSLSTRSTFTTASDSIEALITNQVLPPKPKICLLDPRADQAISPQDAEQFNGFLFGGILGDDPPRDRTSELRKLGFPSRHLGNIQMTTDTAVYVTSLVIDRQGEVSCSHSIYVAYC